MERLGNGFHQSLSGLERIAFLHRSLAQRDIPYLRHTRLTRRAFYVERDDILARLGITVQRIPLSRICTVSEVPMPAVDLANGLILKGDEAPVHVEDLEAPARVDSFLELIDPALKYYYAA
jgi:hypothetical protein